MAGEAEVQDYNEGHCEKCGKTVPEANHITLDQHYKGPDGNRTFVRSWYCDWHCLARHAAYVRVCLKG